MDATQPASRPPRWGIGDAIAGLLSSIAFTTTAAFVLVALGYDDTLEVWFLVGTIVAGWAGLALWLFIASYGKGARDLTVDFGLDTRRWDVLRGIGVALLTLFVVGLFSTLFDGGVGDPTFGEVDPQGTAEFVALGVVIVLGAPFVEELFFRGLFLRAFRRRIGSAGAVIVTSTVFGLLHVPQRESLGFVPALVPLLLIGLVLGWLAVRYGRLGPSIYAHITINGLGFLGLMASWSLEAG